MRPKRIEMKSANLLHNNGNYENSDENYTPEYAVKPILKYIPKDAVVWCPFDTKDSKFVELISKTNQVIYSHINEGKDFFEYEPEKYDVIISNPPFKKKRLFFERALELDKPFALLMTLACLNDKYPVWSFYEHNKDFQLLKFDKRIHFIKPDGTTSKKTTFQSGYMCCDFLPKQVILEKL
jgi:hypothetical protein